MKILLTLGTTPFDSLVRYIDTQLNNTNIVIQSMGNYIPKNHEHFSFESNINKIYKDYDIIITHAGAGSIYNLLEMKKKIVIVPNLERVDNHQQDIALYVEKNNYALIAWRFEEIPICLDKIKNGIILNKYTKDEFKMYNDIIQFIKS
ncbi:PssE/Cps14G family polysaccharide biosynthesis glycosyltransferase [Providencia rettgeri]|uniref:PssE/Cps14G family polysaccharide biosynthesis glycosyltransferase n=1 Tax=Providencia sp. PROV272 TaxID=2936800 RepID=UPI0034E73F28